MCIGHFGFSQTDCPYFDTYIKLGDAEIRRGNEARFEYAINQYSIAMVHCPDRAEEVRAKILIAFEAIEQLKEDAQRAERTTQAALKELRAKKERLAETLAKEQRAQAEMRIANAQTDSALQQATDLINAYYFFDKKYALAYGERDLNKVFYFIDTLGDEVEKLGRWKKAEQFDFRGVAKVKSVDKSDNFLLDTLGNVYSVVYSISEVTNTTQALDLVGNNLAQFEPQGIETNTSLLYLNLNGTNLEKLPKEIGGLKTLTQLDLGNCYRMKRCPPEVGSLESLTNLSLNGTFFDSLPPEIGNLKKLKLLDLGNTKVTYIPPEIENLDALENLILYGSGLETLCSEFGNLKNLRYLDISYHGMIPAELGNLSSLEYLKFTESYLVKLPPDIGRLGSLVTLDLSGAYFDSLPPEIGNLNSLKHLDLSGTYITGLPPEIGNLSSLMNLNLSSSQIENLPIQIGNLQNLKVLSLWNCERIESIPQEISNLDKLERLELIGTQISLEDVEYIREALPNCQVIHR
jgi:hypothetical protein